MTYRITLALAGGYTLVCLADEGIADAMRDAHALPTDLIQWPIPDTTPETAWPAGQLQIRWSDVVILGLNPVPHG